MCASTGLISLGIAVSLFLDDVPIIILHEKSRLTPAVFEFKNTPYMGWIGLEDGYIKIALIAIKANGVISYDPAVLHLQCLNLIIHFMQFGVRGSYQYCTICN